MKQLMLLFLSLWLYSYADAQNSEQHPVGQYTVTAFNENLVDFKYKVLERLKLPKKIRNLDAEGVINYRLYADDRNGNLWIPKALSNIGFDMEHEVLNAINNLSKDEEINLSKMAARTVNTHIDVDFPFYIYKEEVLRGGSLWGGSIGAGRSDDIFIMSIDTYCNGDQYSDYNFANVFPEGGYVAFLTDLSLMFTYKIRTSDISSKKIVKPIKVSFTIDETGQFEALKLIDEGVYGGKEYLECMREYLKAFSLKPALANDKPISVPYVLVVNVHDKSSSIVGLFKNR